MISLWSFIRRQTWENWWKLSVSYNLTFFLRFDVIYMILLLLGLINLDFLTFNWHYWDVVRLAYDSFPLRIVRFFLFITRHHSFFLFNIRNPIGLLKDNWLLFVYESLRCLKFGEFYFLLRQVNVLNFKANFLVEMNSLCVVCAHVQRNMGRKFFEEVVHKFTADSLPLRFRTDSNAH